MKHLRNMWYILKDHYKDADKHYEFAEEAYEDDHKELAKYHIECGLKRIDMMKDTDKMFRKIANEHLSGHKTDDLLWKEMYNDVIEEAEHLESCLIKMKQKIMM